MMGKKEQEHPSKGVNRFDWILQGDRVLITDNIFQVRKEDGLAINLHNMSASVLSVTEQKKTLGGPSAL